MEWFEILSHMYLPIFDKRIQMLLELNKQCLSCVLGEIVDSKLLVNYT